MYLVKVRIRAENVRMMLIHVGKVECRYKWVLILLRCRCRDNKDRGDSVGLGWPDQQRRGGGHPDPRAQPEAAGEQEVERVGGGGPGQAWVQGEHRHTARLALELQRNNKSLRSLKLVSRHYWVSIPIKVYLPWVYAHLALCLNRFLDVKAVVAAFKQEKRL